jgi:predicted O-methyltransferase YrrM
MVLEEILLLKSPVSVKPIFDIPDNCSKSYKTFCILEAAVNIRLFDILSMPKTLNELCDALGTDPDVTRNICTILTCLGLLDERGGLFKNTELSDCYLRSDSPLFLDHIVKNVRDGFEIWKRLDESAKNGPIVIPEETFFGNFMQSHASEALCGELQRVVHIISTIPEFKNAKKLLDLGGGHGLYAIAFTKANPNLEAYVFDFPDVLEHTKRNIKKFTADRVKVIPGNFFTDDIGAGYDMVFFSYNPGGKNPGLVPKIHSSLNDGGLFVTKHVFYHEGEGSKDPLLDIEWNLVAWKGVKKEARIYSFDGDLTLEAYNELLERYFSIMRIIDAPDFVGHTLSKLGDSPDSKLIIAKKKNWRTSKPES